MGKGQVVVVEAEEEELVTVPGLLISTCWLATGAGCVAIWPVTVPNPAMRNRREVAMLALPVEGLLNLGKKAHNVDEAEEGKSVSAP